MPAEHTAGWSQPPTGPWSTGTNNLPRASRCLWPLGACRFRGREMLLPENLSFSGGLLMGAHSKRGRSWAPQNKTKGLWHWGHCRAARALWAVGSWGRPCGRRNRGVQGGGSAPHLTPKAVPADMATDRDQAPFSGSQGSRAITDRQHSLPDPPTNMPRTVQKFSQ